VWHSLSASTHPPPTHVFLSLIRPGGSISKARGGVGSGSDIVQLREWQQRRHRQAKSMRSSALPPRLPRAQKLSNPSSSATNARTTWKMPHSIYTKIVCVRLPVATAIWRTVIHCYWMLVLLTQYVGLVWNPPTHLSVCHSATAYTLYHSDGWIHTVTPEYIHLPHTLNAYRSWSVHIFTYSISEIERYLPLPSIPGAGNTIAVADPAVVMNFRL